VGDSVWPQSKPGLKPDSCTSKVGILGPVVTDPLSRLGILTCSAEFLLYMLQGTWEGTEVQSQGLVTVAAPEVQMWQGVKWKDVWGGGEL